MLATHVTVVMDKRSGGHWESQPDRDRTLKDPYQLTYTNVLLVFFVFIFIPMKILLSSIHLFIHNTLTKHLLCAN